MENKDPDIPDLDISLIVRQTPPYMESAMGRET